MTFHPSSAWHERQSVFPDAAYVIQPMLNGTITRLSLEASLGIDPAEEDIEHGVSRILRRRQDATSGCYQLR